MGEEDVVDIYNGIQLTYKKKMNTILPLAATWIDVEDNMLSELSQ